MIRTGDPRFRRRLNEFGDTVERANVFTQSSIYVFTQNYINPCLSSVGNCLTSCVDASCPSLNLGQRRRHPLRGRGRGRSRGRAELSFDFYDDWDEDEADGLLGWGDDDLDRLLAGRGGGGYGTAGAGGGAAATQQQPARQKGMNYPKGRRKSAVQAHDGGPDPTVIPGSSTFFGRLFGGKPLRYKPTGAGLQDHPGSRRLPATAPLPDPSARKSKAKKHHNRARSGTAASHETTNTDGSLSSRGDIFPTSDDELDDALPLDDEFAMVLERRATRSGQETESSSGHTRSAGGKRSKRPSAAGSSRASTRSERSTRSSVGARRSNDVAGQGQAGMADETLPNIESVPLQAELNRDDARIDAEYEQDEDATQYTVADSQQHCDPLSAHEHPHSHSSSKDATPQARTPILSPQHEEPSQLPTPLATDDEEDEEAGEQRHRAAASSSAQSPS